MYDKRAIADCRDQYVPFTSYFCAFCAFCVFAFDFVSFKAVLFVLLEMHCVEQVSKTISFEAQLRVQRGC